MKESLIYLASPYSHPSKAIREMRFRTVSNVASRLTIKGYFIISPISMNHPWSIYCDPEETIGTSWDYWQKYDTRLIEACDELWVCMMDGWTESKGVTAELQIAEEQKLVIKYVDPLTLKISEAANV